MYLIDKLTENAIQNYRQRSQNAIVGLQYAISNASQIIQLKTIDKKWKFISDCMGLCQENGNSLYNYFIPLNGDIVFLLRNGNHNNTNPLLYNKHEKNGRPNKRYIVFFKNGNVFCDDSTIFLDAEHHTIQYGVDALDNEESIVRYCQAYIELFKNGNTSFPNLPTITENNKDINENNMENNK